MPKSSNAIARYIELISKFLSNTIDAKEFEQSYLAMFKAEPEAIPEADYRALDSLFADLDMLCLDSELFEEGDLTESDLRQSAQRTLDILEGKKHD